MKMMALDEFSDVVSAPYGCAVENVIAFDGVCKRFGDHVALHNVSFAVARGETVGFIGPNGAGKTTTIRIILGILAPSAGSASTFGCPTDRFGFAEKRRISCVLENPGIYDDLKVRDNLMLYARIYRVPKAEERIRSLLDLTGLAGRGAEKAGRLSKGMKQKLALARCLLWDPELLVLDEPTAGLDPLFQKEILDLIRQLGKRGKTVFFSSHHLEEVQDVCSKVAMIDGGILLAFEPIDSLLARFQNMKKRVCFETDLDKQVFEAAINDFSPVSCATTDRSVVILLRAPDQALLLDKLLAERRLTKTHIENLPVALNDVFHILVERRQRDWHQ